MKISMKNGDVIVNGKSYKGTNIVVTNDRVIIDGVEQGDSYKDQKISVVVNGTVESMSLSGADLNINGNVFTVNVEGGNVKCEEILGNVNVVNGNIKCKSIEGNVQAVNSNVSKF